MLVKKVRLKGGIGMSKGQREMTHEELKYAYMKKVQRVQELEELKSEAIKQIDVTHRRNERLEKRVQEIEQWVFETKPYIKSLEQQNKRYRERIEYMLEEAKDHKIKGLRIQHWALIKDLEETLEGEE